MTALNRQDIVDLVALLDVALKHPTLGGLAIAQRAVQLGEALRKIGAEADALAVQRMRDAVVAQMEPPKDVDPKLQRMGARESETAE